MNGLLTQEQIIKQAFLTEFVDGAIDTLKDKMDFKHRPFELIFGTLVPSIVFSKSFLLGGLLYAAEISGFGPGQLGARIDERLGLHTDSPDLSESNMSQTAEGVVDEATSGISFEKIGDFFEEKWNQLKGFAKEKFSSDYYSILNQLKISKGYLSENDYFAAKAYAMCSNDIVKFAGIKQFKKMNLKDKKFSIVSVLLWIIKRVVKGLLGLGIAGGLLNMTRPSGSPEISESFKSNKEDVLIMPKTVDFSGSKQDYKNTERDVAKTLVKYLDGEFVFYDKSKTKDLTFSEKFYELNNVDVLSSANMNELLSYLPLFNRGRDISELNDSYAFSGPNLDDIAAKLMPGFNVSQEQPQVAEQKPKQTKKPSIKKDKREDAFVRYFS